MNVGQWLKDWFVMPSYLITERFEILIKNRGELRLKILRVIILRHLQVGVDVWIPKGFRFDLPIVHYPFPIDKLRKKNIKFKVSVFGQVFDDAGYFVLILAHQNGFVQGTFITKVTLRR